MRLNILKNKILISVVGIILFFGVLATLVIFISTKNALVEMQKGALTIATIQETELLTQIFNQSASLVKFESEDRDIINYLKGERKLQDPEILRILERCNFGDRYSAIYIMQADGTTLVSTNEAFVGKNYGFREYFQAALKGQPAVDVAIDVTSNQLGYYFAHPIEENGEILGVFIAKMSPDVVNSALERKESLGEAFEFSNFILIDDLGIVLYANDKDMIYKSLGFLSDEELKSIKERKKFANKEILPLGYDAVFDDLPKVRDFKSFNIYDEYHEEMEQLLIAKLPNFPFYIMLETKEEKIEQSALLSASLIGLFVLMAAFCAMLLILLIATRFLSPLKKLIEMSKELAKGNYKARVNIKTRDEFEELGDSFNKMANKLNKSKSKIEEKIDERTKELNKMNKFMVNRELRMIELKKEIKNLKEQKNEDKK